MEKIDIIEHFSYAFEKISRTGEKDLIEYCVDLMVPAFDEMDVIYDRFCSETEELNDDDMFNCFQEVLSYFVVMPKHKTDCPGIDPDSLFQV